MSFFLDPPALFIIGMFLLIVKQERAWKLSRIINIGLILTAAFLVISPALYLDWIDWPLPATSGPDWMFHTGQTGIVKADVSVGIVIFMFLLYPIWFIFGYRVGQRVFAPRP